MEKIRNLMISEFAIDKLGYDFMGYTLQRGDEYNFHHLIVPARKHGAKEFWNGAVLCGKTSHPYLHLIEAKDYKTFCYITAEMVDMNIKRYLDAENLQKIDELLSEFEYKNRNLKNRKGKLLIKDDYLRRRGK